MGACYSIQQFKEIPQSNISEYNQESPQHSESPTRNTQSKQLTVKISKPVQLQPQSNFNEPPSPAESDEETNLVLQRGRLYNSPLTIMNEKVEEIRSKLGSLFKNQQNDPFTISLPPIILDNKMSLELFTKAIGKEDYVTALENNYGLMDNILKGQQLNFVNDQINGYGRLIHSDGEYYEGEWINEKAEGYGVYQTENVQYTGTWKQNQQHGVLQQNSLIIVTSMGLKNGKMVVILKVSLTQGKNKAKANFFGMMAQSIYSINNTDQSYSGDFYDNNFHGEGTYKWADGRIYIGQWANNVLDGEGEYKWPDGSIYKGQFVNDKKHGYGEYFWPDGRIYKGNWANGKQDGEGIFTRRDKSMIKGEWRNGIRITYFEVKQDKQSIELHFENGR